jgi:hypothetical protein
VFLTFDDQSGCYIVKQAQNRGKILKTKNKVLRFSLAAYFPN